MKKLRNLTAAIVALAILAFGCSAVACSSTGTNGSNLTYEVTVNCDNALILSTITVEIKGGDGVTTVGSSRLTAGKATFSLPAGNYTATLKGALDHYDYEPAALTPTVTSATIDLTEKQAGGSESENTVRYTVTILTPDNRPVAGLIIQLCGGVTVYACHPAETDERGQAVFDLEPAVYDLHIEEGQAAWPEGLVFDNDAFKTTTDGGQLTARFQQAVTYTITVAYADESPAEGLEVVLQKRNVGDGAVTAEPLTLKANTDSSGVATFKTLSGVFTVSITNCPGGYEYSTGLQVEDREGSRALRLQLMELGRDAYHAIVVTEGTHSATLGSDGKVWYRFDPQGVYGYYRITTLASGGADINMRRFAGNSAFINTAEPIQTDLAEGDVDAEFLISDRDVQGGSRGNLYVLEFTSASGEDAAFSLTIEKARDYVPPVRNVLRPHAAETSTTRIVPDEDSRFTFLNTRTAADVVYSEADGFYHYGAEDGTVVLAAVGDGASGGAYSPQGMDNSCFADVLGENGQGESAFTWSDGKVNDDNTITVYNCTDFILDYADAADEYGLHPLTEELKKFLQKYASMNGISGMLNWDNDSPYLFAFACGYYASEYLAPEGSGTQDLPYVIEGIGTYAVTLQPGQTLYFTANVDCTLTSTSTGFKLVMGSELVADGSLSADLTAGTDFTLVSQSEGAVSVVLAVGAARGSLGAPVVLETGDNQIVVPTASLGAPYYLSYTRAATVLVKFTLTDGSATVTVNGSTIDAASGSVTVEAIASRPCLLAVTASEPELTITVSNVLENSLGGGDGSAPDKAHMLVSGDGWYRVQATTETDGNYGSFYAFTNSTGADLNMRITIFNPAASMIFYGESTESSGSALTLGSDEPSAHFDFTVEAGKTYYFFMSTADGNSATYFFLLSTLE